MASDPYERPSPLALIAAIYQAARSPCRKSRRGVAAFNLRHRYDITGPSAAEGYVYSAEHNRMPLAECDGSAECRAACGRRCVHAEAAAMLAMPEHARRVDLVHVKACESLPTTWGCTTGLRTPDFVLDRCVEPSGLPSCLPCAVLIAADPRVDAIWLLHREGLVTSTGEPLAAGWRRWPAREFLAETEAQVLR